jgi:hypothetical protein
VATDAYNAGSEAAKRGKLRSANPHYPLAEPFRSDWFAGFDYEALCRGIEALRLKFAELGLSKRRKNLKPK